MHRLHALMLTCVYICVDSTLRCPSIACIHLRSAPFSSICVAIVYRNRWQLPYSIPDTRRYGTTAFVMPFAVRSATPSIARNNALQSGLTRSSCMIPFR